MNHGGANFMKKKPGTSVAPEANVLLEIESIDSCFLSCRPPNGVEPDF